MMSTRLLLAASLLSAVALVACKKDTPTTAPTVTPAPSSSAPAMEMEPTMPSEAGANGAKTVSMVEVGNAIGADKRVVSPSNTLGTNDTIYVAVVTEGAASGNVLAATIHYQDGQQVFSENKTLTANGQEVVEFHMSNSNPWPTGNYKVTVTLDGMPMQTHDFAIR